MRFYKLETGFLFTLIVGFLIRLFLAGSLKQFTVYNDLLTFQAWGNILAENGFSNFYFGWSDYLPGYLYILSGLSIFYKFLVTNSVLIPVEIFYKLPSIITDIGNTGFIYLIVKRFTSNKNAFYTAVFYYFNPVFWANSTLWGQAESFMMFFLLSSFYCIISGKYFLSALLIAIGQVVKPIAILTIPIYLLYMIYEKTSLKTIIIYLSIFISIIVLLFIPFSNTENILNFIVQRHNVTANQYPYTSVNAFNFWSLMTHMWYPDDISFYGITLHNWGSILFVFIYSFLFINSFLAIPKINNKPLFLIFVLTIIYFSMFIFLTRMHERHFYYGLTYLSVLLPLLSNKFFIVVICVYFINLLNLYYPYSQATPTPLFLDNKTIGFISAFNVIALVYLIKIFISKYVKFKSS